MDWNLNWAAVVVSAVLYFLVGWLWYSPVLFAKPWLAAMKLDPDHMKRDAQNKKRMIRGMGGSLLAAIVMATVLGLILRNTHADTLGMAIGWALLAGVGLVGMVMGTNALYTGNGKLYVINVGYPIVGYIVMAIVQTLWK